MELINRILNKVTKNEMKELFYSEVCGFHFISFWDIFMFNLLNELDLYDSLTYQERRQLFLDLVRHYMEKGLLKFQDGEVRVNFERLKDRHGEYYFTKGKKIFWKGESTTIEETIKFLDKYMPTGDEEEFEEEPWMMDFFYSTCPYASYWYDGSDPNYPEAKWIHSS